MTVFFNWDFTVFKWINIGLSSDILDAILPWMREPLFWVPLYVFILAFMFFNYGKRAYWVLVFVLLTVGTSDMTSSHLIKKTVQRLRPCNDTEVPVVRRVRCGGGYSFTSSHATNHFAIASFFAFTIGLYFRRIRPWLWLWAFIISLSQVYVGVHYPFDILVGGILGILIGRFWAAVFNKYHGEIFKPKLIIT